MGLFNFFKKESVQPEDVDYMSRAAEFEKAGDFGSAINEYEKIIQFVYAGKESKYYVHVTKKILNCCIKMGDYDRVMSLWSQQYSPSDYGAKEMYELIKILESAQKMELVAKVYDQAGKKLIRNKIDFLIKQKKIPEANELMNELLALANPASPGMRDLWMIKAKLCLSLRKWDEGNKFLNKILEKDTRNAEALKLKDFCMKQVRRE
jgi:tetratricopeptide (TPR) repeat protein